MGISIYYTASRAQKLAETEQKAIEAVILQYSVKDRVEAYIWTGVGWSGEDFCLYDPPFDTPDVVLDGATRLPDSSQEAFRTAVRHWCRALSEIRRVLPNAMWHVHVDDYDIGWDETRQEFDPSM